MKPVKDNPSWFQSAHILVNIDNAQRETYIKNKNMALTKRQEMEHMHQSINNLNNRISEIENSMSQILSLLQNGLK